MKVKMISMLLILYYAAFSMIAEANTDVTNDAVEKFRQEGMSYGDVNDFDAAIDSFKKAIDLDKKNSKSYMLLGLAYLQKGEIDKAITFLQKASELDSNNYEIYAPLSSAYQSIGDMQNAINCYIKFIDGSPDQSLKAQTYVLLANLYKNTGEYDKARNAMNQAIKIFQTEGDEQSAETIRMMKGEIP